MNLCHPDEKRSCAACCGLYNVKDATRQALSLKLERQTLLFGQIERSAAAISDYGTRVAREAAGAPLDPEIHVCEFIGFLDAHRRLVGCMLHPAAQGNQGVDFRGLCHYGSMACKSFFCPAWDQIPPQYRDTLMALVEDWHLYGLVITDVDFVMSLFGLLEHRLGHPPISTVLLSDPARPILSEMFSWKDSWPFGSASARRRCRYYFKSSFHRLNPDFDANLARFLGTLEFTYELKADPRGAAELVRGTLDCLVEAYGRSRIDVHKKQV